MRGAERLVLDRQLHRVVREGLFQGIGDLLALMPDDDDDPRRTSQERGPHGVADHGSTGDGMKNLDELRAHPSA